ncbi:MAG: 3-hydroxyacyl-ACP dehydratase FabZ [Armatimonadetes bacterium]|jgi:3-hydroxyacyl-[acyl-carrier-protein] dehydratase|nr:3-hydroxyacyl-ACP dehydratase FabZ [Armatimonadota bacterium]
MIDIETIRDTIPHRYPFLLVDRIVEVSEDGDYCVGIKNVTANEKILQGHLPGQAIFPGVLIVEHMAQVGCYLLMTKPEAEGKLAYFAAIDGVRFKRAAIPGDTIVTTVRLLSGRRGIWKISAESKVGDDLVCRGELTCALVEY